MREATLAVNSASAEQIIYNGDGRRVWLLPPYQKEENLLLIKSGIQSNLQNIKAFSAKRYSGKLKLKEDPLAYQKRVRKEWNEYSD